MSSPNPSGSGDATTFLVYPTLPKIPSSVVSFEAEMSNRTSSFRISGSRSDNLVRGTVEERGSRAELTTSAIPFASSSSGQVTVSTHDIVGSSSADENADEDSSDENDKDDIEESVEDTTVLENPYSTSLQVGQYTILMDNRVVLDDIKESPTAGLGISFMATCPQVKDVSFGMGGGNIMFRIAFGTNPQLSLGYLKVIPPPDKTESIIKWEKIDGDHVRIICA